MTGGGACVALCAGAAEASLVHAEATACVGKECLLRGGEGQKQGEHPHL